MSSNAFLDYFGREIGELRESAASLRRAADADAGFLRYAATTRESYERVRWQRELALRRASELERRARELDSEQQEATSRQREDA